MKLIKINDNHYIIVDDSEIKEDNYYFSKITNNVFIRRRNGHWIDDYDKVMYKKITHSTQPLEYTTEDHLHYYKIKQLSLSEVEEAIYGYSVEKMAREKYRIKNPLNDYDERYFNSHGVAIAEGYIDGFNAYKELVKDKLFTVEQAYLIWKAGQEYWKTSGTSITFEELVEKRKQLLPEKTEWDVTFDEQRKIKLI